MNPINENDVDHLDDLTIGFKELQNEIDFEKNLKQKDLFLNKEESFQKSDCDILIDLYKKSFNNEELYTLFELIKQKSNLHLESKINGVQDKNNVVQYRNWFEIFWLDFFVFFMMIFVIVFPIVLVLLKEN